MKGIIFLGLCVSSVSVAQKTDSIKTQDIEIVSFTKKLPVTKDIIWVERDLSAKNLGQDLPILLKNHTSFLSSSDTGNGIGYTDLRIRGVAGTSINIMLNGVPFNDSESQETFFVNIPDLTSSASQILIQRGVGTSSNGTAAFGASINILTKNPEEKPYFLSDLSYGSFNTEKQSIEAGSGNLFNGKLSLNARYSKIKSDGYIDRAFSDLESYNFSALLKNNQSQLKIIAFGGKEKTYQAWNGIDAYTYKINRKHNYSGNIYNNTNGVKYYDNETDNYRQNHYHLIFNQKLNEHWSLETTLHYTKGKGFYENYKQDQKPSKYHLNLPNLSTTDFIRKKWLDNDFYGFIQQFFGKYNKTKIHFGLTTNQYIGKHFGRVSSAFGVMNIPNEHEYYRNHSSKNDISSFGKIIYSLQNLELFGDIQFRHIQHKAQILQNGDNEGGNFNRIFNFINPKAGINYHLSKGKIYFSYALAHREPNRKDIISQNNIQHETLHDFELGIEKNWRKTSISFNAYYMYYLNQLVFSGKINNVGAFIRENSGKSYRRGLEFSLQTSPTKNIKILANANWSQNKNINFHSKENETLKYFGTTTIALSPNFIGNIGIEQQITPNFHLALQNQYVSHQFLDNTQNQQLSIPDYYVMDLNAGYQLRFTETQLNIYFSLNNILNKMYINKGYVYEKTPYYFPQAGRNFMLGMKILFH